MDVDVDVCEFDCHICVLFRNWISRATATSMFTTIINVCTGMKCQNGVEMVENVSQSVQYCLIPFEINRRKIYELECTFFMNDQINERGLLLNATSSSQMVRTQTLTHSYSLHLLHSASSKCILIIALHGHNPCNERGLQ